MLGAVTDPTPQLRPPRHQVSRSAIRYWTVHAALRWAVVLVGAGHPGPRPALVGLAHHRKDLLRGVGAEPQPPPGEVDGVDERRCDCAAPPVL